MPRSRTVALILFAVLGLGTSATAQRPAPVELPRVLRLGPIPAALPVMILTRDGRLAKPSGQAENPPAVLLRIDRGTPLRGVTKLLAKLASGGTGTAHFAAALPDGAEGCFTLALPGEDAQANIAVDLHRRRTGVPPTSLTPVLRRLREWRAKDRFQVGVSAPPDSEWGDVLAVLAAVAAAGVESALVRTSDTGPGGRRPGEVDGGLGALAGALGADAADPEAVRTSGAFAIDVGPEPRLVISARAVPQPRPGIGERAVGFVATPTFVPGPPEIRGGAGGRYGGRGGRGGRRAGYGENIAAAIGYLIGQQLENGAFPGPDGTADVATTALVLLTLLGNGNTMISGPHQAPTSRAAGFLLERQQDDGTFPTSHADSHLAHALATYAMAEAYGLSAQPLLAGSVQAAVNQLADALDPAGGLGPAPGRSPDVRTTALAHVAIGSAQFFAIASPRDPKGLVAWFDRVDSATGPAGDLATRHFCRFFGGQAKTAATTKAAERVAETADASRPWDAYWATYMLFQVGGAPWKDWTEKLAELAGRQLERGDDAGSWPAADGETRITTTALHTLALQGLYRYTRLVR